MEPNQKGIYATCNCFSPRFSVSCVALFRGILCNASWRNGGGGKNLLLPHSFLEAEVVVG